MVDADATAYLSAVQTADGQALEPSVRDAITAFVVGCKADGIWSAIRASCILMGARTLSGALTPLVGTAPTNNNFVAADYNRKTGLVGNGTNKQLNTNRANSADPQDSHHTAAWITTAGTDVRVALSGGSFGVTGGSSLFWNVSLFSASRSNATNSGIARNNTEGKLFAASRSASASYSLRANDSTSTVSGASQSPSAGNIFVFSAGGTFYVDARIAFYSIGEAVTLSQLDSRVASLVSAIGAAIP
jgi:hypothetical protein